ncbi:UDP-N-acetylmuramoyl-tripeptide--D-alanyl-D-alanine ligase [Aureibacter tunicatorum]|uniref:UDP-N-acetylmuramoyl-tripeptide--D-alanyl-D-alanine ligase n=1 Tax=Aureibacter tunicatorum TaxID=866807 RepID=A0AAE4BT73_9BACT|nr:UDP-N-acetylmuramoyl-tripeptide--D-alanyl-D-alanine ligase [Aureibacter tunicatorum]MDR6239247.1 UDP-N-acetylmuramoyl-tripeptide--D-alanyl-D-alanine ligase [Aureibacter tunicatorum]BDD04828.1 UDP-N-acetylmuramoyl-tripeptide--D-alanyl-D-alanine ligase [Aureibacter tunicatorum]
MSNLLSIETDIYSKFLECSGVTANLKYVRDGDLYFALSGRDYDGNSAVGQALEKGAKYAIVDDPRQVVSDQCILVKEVYQVLRKLAKYHRLRFRLPVIAITGSNGKTTTKELIREVLSQKYNVFATDGNQNSIRGGALLNVLRLNNSHEIAVFEIGARRVGDISELCDIIKPNYGLITNIGRAHLGVFGGSKQLIKAKSDLYQYLYAHNGKVFVNAKNRLLLKLSSCFHTPIKYLDDNDLKLVSEDDFVSVGSRFGNTVKTNLIGNYNFENIAAALCIGRNFGVEDEKGIAAVAAYVPKRNRSQFVKRKSNKVIMDAYNANLSSMIASVLSLSLMEDRNKVVILGDMKDLGDLSLSEHEKLGKKLHLLGFDKVILLGEEMLYAKKHCPNAIHFNGKSEMEKYISNWKIEDSVVLIKGSRSMRMESVLDYI